MKYYRYSRDDLKNLGRCVGYIQIATLYKELEDVRNLVSAMGTGTNLLWILRTLFQARRQ
jgi:hypothetical protein